MAAALCLLTEEQLLCPVCDDVFTNPVSTPCGHNFCRDCVSAGSVGVDAPLQCPACLSMFYPRPELQVNALIAGMVQQFRRTAPGGGSGTTGIFCVAWIWFLVFSFLIQPRLRWAEEAAGEKLEGSVRGVIVDLQLKVEEVKRLVEAKVKELPQVEQMIDGVLLRAELMRVRRYAVDLTLDPDAAHSDLILSPDGKQVKRRQSKESFGFSVLVVVKQSFSSGRFYFEVQVQDKTDWTLGVAKESVCRKKEGKLSPRSGYWSISLSSRSELRALADPPVHLPLRWAPEKVGVFVDYEEGLVFFYDAESAAFIFSFTGIFFTERLYPFFDPGLNEDGRNSASLVLGSVGRTE